MHNDDEDLYLKKCLIVLQWQSMNCKLTDFKNNGR